MELGNLGLLSFPAAGGSPDLKNKGTEGHRVLTLWPTAGPAEGDIDPEGKGKRQELLDCRAGETLGSAFLFGILIKQQ